MMTHDEYGPPIGQTVSVRWWTHRENLEYVANNVAISWGTAFQDLYITDLWQLVDDSQEFVDALAYRFDADADWIAQVARTFEEQGTEAGCAAWAGMTDHIDERWQMGDKQ